MKQSKLCGLPLRASLWRRDAGGNAGAAVVCFWVWGGMDVWCMYVCMRTAAWMQRQSWFELCGGALWKARTCLHHRKEAAPCNPQVWAGRGKGLRYLSLCFWGCPQAPGYLPVLGPVWSEVSIRNPWRLFWLLFYFVNVFIVHLRLGTSMSFWESPQIWHFSGNTRDKRDLEKLEIRRWKCNRTQRKRKTQRGKIIQKPNFRGKKSWK